jgi:WD40 repeat protein/transcriptional regulator with XRE-family HTH domain
MDIDRTLTGHLPPIFELTSRETNEVQMETGLSFHQQVKYEREKRGWSQEHVAQQVGVEAKTVARWENNRGLPRPDSRRKLCAIFGMDAEKLGLLKSHADLASSRPSFQGQTNPPLSHDSPSPDSITASVQDGAANHEKNQGVMENHQRFHYVDWSETPRLIDFYGRARELALLKLWVHDSHCQVLAILGAGGVGKTMLSAKLVMQLQGSFSFVFWRSLRHAPPLTHFLMQCIPFISHQECTNLPEDIDDQVTLLIHYCKEYRCLLILDNVESIMQPGQRTGRYREDYKEYGKLFQRMGETQHQSCLLLTSREKPKEIAHLEGKASLTRSLNLLGVETTEGQAILRDKGLLVSDEEATMLVHHYAGNPLALKLVAEPIREVFKGDIARFLREGETTFGDINELLAKQFQRLSVQEEEVLYWLAIELEAVPLEKIRENLVHLTSKRTVVETLDSLYRRSLIETVDLAHFALQPVIMEYVITELVELFCNSFDGDVNNVWMNYALIKARAKDYVRDSQTRLILAPVALRLLTDRGQKEVEQRCRDRLALQQQKYPLQRGYLAGNILHLLIHLQCDLRGLDMSRLLIWQAYLQNAILPDVNFAHAHFVECLFTNTFGNVLAVTFNPHGDLFAVGTATGEVLIYCLSSTALLLSRHEHTDAVWSVAFSPDGRMLASGSDDQTVRLWDLNTGQCLNVLREHTNRVRAVAFTPDGSLFASSGEDQIICLYDADTRQCLNRFRGHTDRVWSLTFSPDGKLLVTGSTDRTIRLWDTQTGTCLNTLEGHTAWVRAVSFHCDGNLLASGGDDQTIRLWNVHTGEQLKILHGHTNPIWSLAFCPDGQKLASGSEDQMIRIWDVHTGQCIKTLQGHAHGIRSVAFSSDGHRLASGGEDQSIHLWDIDRGQCVTRLQGYTNRVWSTIFGSDRHTLASCSEDRMIYLWNIDSARCFRTLRDTKHGVRAIAFNSQGTILASGGEDQTLRLWNIHTGQYLNVLYGHTGWIRSIAFSSDGAMLASGSEDQTVCLWDANTGHRLKVLQGHTNWVRSVAFSPDSTMLASSGDDSIIQLWEVTTGRVLCTMCEHDGSVRSVAFSPNAQLLASSSEDQMIRLWDISSGQCLRTLTGHTNWVRSIAFSPDGYLLASTSDDYTIRLWNVKTGQCLAILRGHRDRVRWVTFHPDGHILASCSDDGSIQLWDTQMQTVRSLKTLMSERPYEHMNITSVRGLTKAQKAALYSLGAFEDS